MTPKEKADEILLEYAEFLGYHHNADVLNSVELKCMISDALEDQAKQIFEEIESIDGKDDEECASQFNSIKKKYLEVR